MFRGNHPTRVDEKGRLKIPAEFKRVIDEKYGQQYYITSLDGKVAQVYPFEEWERIEQKLAGALHFQSYEEKVSRPRELLRTASGNGMARGGCLMPQLLRRGCADQRRGCGYRQFDHLIVRNLESYRKQVEEKSSRLKMRRRSTNWHLVGEGSTDTPQGVGHGGGREAAIL